MQSAGRALSSIAGLVCIAVGTGCGQHADRIVIPAYEVMARPPGVVFRAGAARTDITPPVGYPTGGHGPAGVVARGYWGRLHARAFYFEGKSGKHVVLVSCDTFAIPGALQREVARRVRDLGIYREEIILAATHTHLGAGNYLSASAYNQGGSSYPGFDARLFDFLATRIAEAIRIAHADSRVAGDVSLRVATGRVGDLLRNRAPAPFLLNSEREEVIAALSPPPGSGGNEPCERQCPDRDREDCEPPGGWEPAQGCPRLRAIDRNLTTLQVSRQTSEGKKTIGALVFLAVHPTVLPDDTPFYAGDFVGVAMQKVERSLSKPSRAAVVGFFNGAEGDITARRRWRDMGEVLAFGGALASEVEDTLAHGWEVDVGGDVDVREGDADTSSDRVCESVGLGRVELGRRPYFGAAGIGGAEGDRTAFTDLGWKDGVRTEARSNQGPKLGAFDSKILPSFSLTRFLAPRGKFPVFLPITWARIGSFQLLAFPAELTTTMAYQMRQWFTQPALPHGQMEIIGLANEYASYVTTAAEYAAQHYEGGSTLWGPNEGKYLACWLVSKVGAEDRYHSFSSPTRDWEFDPGTKPSIAFGPEFCGDRRAAPDEGLEKVLLDDVRRPHRTLPWFEWEETLEMASQDFQVLSGSGPRVKVLERVAGGWRPFETGDGAETDRGFGLITMLVDAANESNQCTNCARPFRRRWAAIWSRPALTNLSNRWFRFEIETRWSGWHCSEPFSVGEHGESVGRVPEVSPGVNNGPCP